MGADKRDAGTIAFNCPFSSHVSAWGILGVHFTSTFINIYKLEQQPEVPFYPTSQEQRAFTENHIEDIIAQ